MRADVQRVMIVEDDPDIRESLGDLLEENGYSAICAANGKEALEKLRELESPPCLILLDIMMPVMDGWQFRAEQTKHESLAAIPVIVLTALGGDKLKFNQIRAAGMLRKPVELPELLQAVRQFCTRARPDRE